jgi:hypothetical protein
MIEYETTYTLERESANPNEDPETFELEVSYNYLPGLRARGPTYDCGGEPADPPEVDNIVVTHQDKPFHLTPQEDEGLWLWLLENHWED